MTAHLLKETPHDRVNERFRYRDVETLTAEVRVCSVRPGMLAGACHD